MPRDTDPISRVGERPAFLAEFDRTANLVLSNPFAGAVYMAAQVQASTHGNIKPFARFIAGLLVEQDREPRKRAVSVKPRRSAAKINRN